MVGSGEEAFYFGDVVGAAIGWERVQEGDAVAGGADAGVEKHEDAAVGERADEAAEALFEGDDGLGDLEVVEGIATGGGDGVGAGTAKGSLSMMTQESCSPWTSTPCQKLEVPKRTALGVSRNCWRRMWRGALPCMRRV
jgi:hypothetical protein